MPRTYYVYDRLAGDPDSAYLALATTDGAEVGGLIGDDDWRFSVLVMDDNGRGASSALFRGRWRGWRG